MDTKCDKLSTHRNTDSHMNTQLERCPLVARSCMGFEIIVLDLYQSVLCHKIHIVHSCLKGP